MGTGRLVDDGAENVGAASNVRSGEDFELVASHRYPGPELVGETGSSRCDGRGHGDGAGRGDAIQPVAGLAGAARPGELHRAGTSAYQSKRATPQRLSGRGVESKPAAEEGRSKNGQR